MRTILVWLLAAVAACGSKATPPVAEPVAPEATHALTTWANGAVFYEVFVRSFQDSDGDGKGDLRGLISRLDYLNDGNPATDTDLGVDALWLMPVFASPSYHGYDTSDYDHINPDYGTDQDFEELCRQAHKRGIKIIVDLVLNHTSSKHPWFIDSASSPASAHRDWYVWSPTDPGWGKPWDPSSKSWCPLSGAFYYCLFWSGMPDLNFRSPQVRQEANRIAALWLSRGVDGFRLDASRHLIETGPGDTGQNDTAETHAYWKEFAAFVRKTKPDAVLIGENWTETPIIARYYGDTSVVAGGDELPLSFSFPLAAATIASTRQADASLVATEIAKMQEVFPPGATWVPFLTNHDMHRVATNLKNDQARLRTAAAILLTLPGTPFLYYGEEVGLANGPGDEDESKRTPMPWDGSPGGGFSTGKPWHDFAPGGETANVSAELRDPGSLLSHYRRLIHARHASLALRRGQLDLLSTQGPVLAYQLTYGSERVLVVHNLGDAPQSTVVAASGTAQKATLFGGEGATLAPGKDGMQVSLPGHTSGVWRLK